MQPAGTPILLLGPTTTVGRELLLRLAVVGFEVVAYAPDGDDGQTGEFACTLATDASEYAHWEAGAALVADAQSEAGQAVLLRTGDQTRRFAHAPLMGDVIARVRSAGWRALVADPWYGHALPLIHEREVAQLVVEAVVKDLPSTDFGGPTPLTWRDASTQVLIADKRRRFWHHLAGRWPAREPPGSSLIKMAAYPRTGRRSLADALTCSESAAQSPTAPATTGALSIPRI